MPEAARVLELGCGSGAPWGQEMIARGIGVTGVDAAAGMIEIAAAQEGRWIQGDMRGLSLGERFDGVLAWNSMFHLRPEDQREMFAVFAEHAKPRAVLMFTSGPRAGVEMGTYKGEPLYHASLARDEFRALLDAYGFDLIDHVAEDANSGGHTIWLAHRRV